MKNDKIHQDNPIRRLISGIYTRQEAKQALELLQDRDNDGIVDEHMSEVWTRIKDSTKPTVTEYNRNFKQGGELLKRIEKPSGHKRYLRIGLVAASIALFITFGIIGYKYFDTTSPTEMQYTNVSTGYGEIKEIVLPDGTIAILNACSDLLYPEKFEGDERHIKLEGEAYFHVEKNEEKPFIIATQNFNIRVLGTVFNVRAYGEDKVQSVNVESGKVQVDMPEAMTRLSANEQIEINISTNSYTKNESDYKDISVWRLGTLRFKKTPISDVAKELERVYSCRIVFEPGQSFENIISGEHDNENLEEVLASIRLASGINWKTDKTSNTITLYK